MLVGAVSLATFSPLLLHSKEFTNLDDLDNYRQPLLQHPTWASVRWAVADGVTLGVYEPCAVLLKLLVSATVGLQAPQVGGVDCVLHVLNSMLMAAVAHTAVAEFLFTKADSRNMLVTKSIITFASIACVAVHPIMVEVRFVSFLFCLAK